MRAYIKSLLTDTWDVVAVSNGKDALSAAVAQPPDLILSDVMMPKLDGFGLIARLRQDERTKHVPVLLLSARAAGFQQQLTKPVEPSALIATISSLVHGSVSKPNGH